MGSKKGGLESEEKTEKVERKGSGNTTSNPTPSGPNARAKKLQKPGGGELILEGALEPGGRLNIVGTGEMCCNKGRRKGNFIKKKGRWKRVPPDKEEKRAILEAVKKNAGGIRSGARPLLPYQGRGEVYVEGFQLLVGVKK